MSLVDQAAQLNAKVSQYKLGDAVSSAPRQRSTTPPTRRVAARTGTDNNEEWETF
jgi:methyl-accepting chemotaxis protein